MLIGKKMDKKYYTNEKGPQILIALLKAHGIKRVIASPGTTNMTIVGSMQNDSFFEMYSAVDERSAAYMACGMAADSGEPVVITCTGATASRDYMPGLTEAYYRKLPVLAITANSGLHLLGHLRPQQIDRSRQPIDIANLSVSIPLIQTYADEWAANVNINKAILALTHRGGGPAHINIATSYSKDFSVKELPNVRIINRISIEDPFPDFSNKKIIIFVGSHTIFSPEETKVVEDFCEIHNSVVLVDHTSGYYGKYRIQSAAVMAQPTLSSASKCDILIHIGQVSGDYYTLNISPNEVWRVNPDGEIRDTFEHLHYVFDMPELFFFKKATNGFPKKEMTLYPLCKDEYKSVISDLPELPFSNIWIASVLADQIPAGSEVHLGILNTLRSWNFFEISSGVQTYCNVGGFGIDGVMSTALGASLVNPQKIYYCILGDLAFFYDLNSIANRHLGSNLRILLINNGRGTEFTNYSHPAYEFGRDADKFIAAAGHNGNKSATLVKEYAKALGFRYITASDKNAFLSHINSFITPDLTEQPILFEIFTDSVLESQALEQMTNIRKRQPSIKDYLLSKVKPLANDKLRTVVKKITGK